MEIVIIGNGPAAISAVEAIRRIDRDIGITIVSKEGEPAYTPCFLFRYVSGEIGKEKLYMREGNFYDLNNVKTLLGSPVKVIDTDKKRVILDSRELYYDRLLIAAGSSTLIPPIPGIEGRGIFPFKAMKDADGIIKATEDVGDVVVIGAGFIGLEIAGALCRRGLSVTVIERKERILPRMLDDEMAGILWDHLERNGLRIVTGKDTAFINRNRKGVIEGIILEDGSSIPCGIVVVAAGVRPNTGIIKESRIRTDHGIVVDDHMRTEMPDVYAAGDIAEIEINGVRKINPIHTNAVRSGEVAGYNMAGMERRMDYHIEDMNVVTLFGLSVLSMGIQTGDRVIKNDRTDSIIKAHLGEDGGIKGIQIIGDVMRGGVYLSLLRRDIPLSDTDVSPRINYGYSLKGVKSISQ